MPYPFNKNGMGWAQCSHSNWCKGPISSCQSIQGWNDVLFMYLYGWVDLLIRVVSIVLKCIVVFSQHLFAGLSWFVASNVLNCTIASCFFIFVFWSWFKPLQICLTNSIFHFFDPKSTFGLSQQWFKNITMPTNKL